MHIYTLRKSFGSAKKAAVSLLCSLAMAATLSPAVALAAPTDASGIAGNCQTDATTAPANDSVQVDITLSGTTEANIPDCAQLDVKVTNGTATSWSSEAPNFQAAYNNETGVLTVSYYGLQNRKFDTSGIFKVGTFILNAKAEGEATAAIDANASVVGFQSDTKDYSIAAGTTATVTFTEAKAATVERLAGSTAMQTAVTIAAKAYTSSNAAIVATATSYYDALAASAFAGLLDCPILLMYSDDAYNDDVYAELSSLGVKDIYIAGGEAAISAEIENKLAQNYNVERVDGSSLPGYEGYAIDTALDFATRVRAMTTSHDAILVTHRSFMDALSMSSYAYATGTPIVMIDWDLTLGDRAKAILDSVDGTIYVAGGTSAVPEASAEAYYGEKIIRLQGDTGFDTSRVIATYLIEKGMASANTVCVAAGTASLSGVDALAGAALAGVNNGVILLASWDQEEFDYYDAIAGFMDTYAGSVKNAYILGGTAALLPDYFDYVANYLGAPHEVL